MSARDERLHPSDVPAADVTRQRALYDAGKKCSCFDVMGTLDEWEHFANGRCPLARPENDPMRHFR